MRRDAPHVTGIRVDDDQAHYYAANALDEVLDWFVNDGYTREDLEELVISHAADAFGDDEA